MVRAEMLGTKCIGTECMVTSVKKLFDKLARRSVSSHLCLLYSPSIDPLASSTEENEVFVCILYHGPGRRCPWALRSWRAESSAWTVPTPVVQVHEQNPRRWWDAGRQLDSKMLSTQLISTTGRLSLQRYLNIRPSALLSLPCQ